MQMRDERRERVEGEREKKVRPRLERNHFGQIAESLSDAARLLLSPLIQRANDGEGGGGECTQGHEEDGWRGRGTGVERQEGRIVRSE